eukprot:GHUV01049895.1.p2 GENE.GHUV01049895.1~~GHUV01049895.1.p2  ORF type:complete len:149 (-),score=23.42 GHUV01049895.1:233-679(-)
MLASNHLPVPLPLPLVALLVAVPVSLLAEVVPDTALVPLELLPLVEELEPLSLAVELLPFDDPLVPLDPDLDPQLLDRLMVTLSATYEGFPSIGLAQNSHTASVLDLNVMVPDPKPVSLNASQLGILSGQYPVPGFSLGWNEKQRCGW